MQIDRDVLLKAITLPVSVVDQKAYPPILNNVLITISNDEMIVYGTDSETDIITKTKLNSLLPEDIDIAAVVNAKKLYDIVKSLKEGSTVKLSYDDDSHKLKLSSGKSKFNLVSESVNDFPSQPQREDVHISINCKTFYEMLNFVTASMPSNDTRFYLNGVYIVFIENDESNTYRYDCVATDGFRLSLASSPLETGIDSKLPSVIIPQKAVHSINKLLAARNDDFELSITNDSISMLIDNTRITSKIIDGKYPTYTNIILQPKFEIKIQRQKLLKYIQQAGVIGTLNLGKEITLYIKDDVIKISCDSSNHNEKAEIIADVIEKCDLPEFDFDIVVNYVFLSELLKSFTSEIVTFGLIDKVSSISIFDDTNRKAILMPIIK